MCNVYTYLMNGFFLGGTLMSLEEGTSFWSSSLMWKVFFCAAIAFPTYNAGRNVIFSKKLSEFYKISQV